MTQQEKAARFLGLTTCAISPARLRENSQGNGLSSAIRLFSYEINSLPFSNLPPDSIKRQARPIACITKDARV